MFTIKQHMNGILKKDNRSINDVPSGESKNNNSVMYPNKNFFKFFGEQEDVKLSKLKAVFSSSTRKEAGKVDNHIAYGGYVLISAIARKTGCYEILKKVFPKHYKLILALCTYGVSEATIFLLVFWTLLRIGSDCL